jgi:hypothetical protein
VQGGEEAAAVGHHAQAGRAREGGGERGRVEVDVDPAGAWHHPRRQQRRHLAQAGAEHQRAVERTRRQERVDAGAAAGAAHAEVERVALGEHALGARRGQHR